MSLVHFVKAAAKDYPHAGIAKGESYYWWQHFRQPRQMSKEIPKASQIASSEFERSVYALLEGLETWASESWEESDRDDLVSELEQIRDQEQDKFDNMPEGFQQGDTGVKIEERISALEDWINELNSIDFESEGDQALYRALETAISL